MLLSRALSVELPLTSMLPDFEYDAGPVMT
jgi:hypothetical protein